MLSNTMVVAVPSVAVLTGKVVVLSSVSGSENVVVVVVVTPSKAIVVVMMAPSSKVVGVIPSVPV